MLGEIKTNSVLHADGMIANSCGLSEIVWTNPHEFLTGTQSSGSFIIKLQSLEIS